MSRPKQTARRGKPFLPPHSTRPAPTAQPPEPSDPPHPPSSPDSPSSSPPTLFNLPGSSKTPASSPNKGGSLMDQDIAMDNVDGPSGHREPDTELTDTEDEEERPPQALNTSWPALSPTQKNTQVSQLDEPQAQANKGKSKEVDADPAEDQEERTQIEPEEHYQDVDNEDNDDDLNSLNSFHSLSMNNAPSASTTKTLKRKRSKETQDDDATSSDDQDAEDGEEGEDATQKGSEVEEEEGPPRKRTPSTRRFFGYTKLNVPILKAPKGRATAIGTQKDKWPKKGKDTLKGRMQALGCEVCKGWVHWVCAGLEKHQTFEEEEWKCPSCTTIKRSQSVSRAAPIHCIRPDCVMRGKQAPAVTEGDSKLWLLRCIIGSKLVGSKGGRKQYRYLVAWVGWENCDATWEPPEHIDHLEFHTATFTADAMKQGKDPAFRGVVLLEEAEEDWDKQGKLKTKRSAKWVKEGWKQDIAIE